MRAMLILRLLGVSCIVAILGMLFVACVLVS
jgi:hypothetical protein